MTQALFFVVSYTFQGGLYCTMEVDKTITNPPGTIKVKDFVQETNETEEAFYVRVNGILEPYAKEHGLNFVTLK